ncbi:MAG TPA: hypothetical protein VFD94_01695 [Jatrophihabitans sp.]|nr:hypothetical protein [Jatrophihabitans sp.]
MTSILFAKESDCEENPEGLDLRATLIPDHVGDYVRSGYEVVVQAGLGEGVGYLDRMYELQGAKVEPYPSCYSGKDLVVKLKGPAAGEIAELSQHTTLFSMGHIYCFPERKRLLEAKDVRLVAMESVTQPYSPSAEYQQGICAGAGMDHALLGSAPTVLVAPSADQRYLNGLLRALMRHGGVPIRVSALPTETAPTDDGSVRIVVRGLRAELHTADGRLSDLSIDPAVTDCDHLSLLKEELGKSDRAIGQIREVGIGGARYGLQLWQSMNQGQAPTVLVLGYGNVSMGAFELFRNEGVDFTILGRAQTSKQALPAWLAGAQLIVNGAETPGDTEYIITQQNSDHDIAPGSVVIDLIGGSPYLRSPVEHFQWTTFLTEIHHEYNGHYYAGLWGWDMFYSMTDTAAEYSRRIKDVLTGNRGYAGDLDRFFTEHAYAAQLGL